jgi:hypothetical protein
MKLKDIDDVELLRLYNVDRMSFAGIVQYLKDKYKLEVTRQGVKLRLEKIPGYQPRDAVKSHKNFWDKKRDVKADAKITKLLEIFQTPTEPRLSIRDLALMNNIPIDQLRDAFIKHPNWNPKLRANDSLSGFVVRMYGRGVSIKDIAEKHSVTQDDVIAILKKKRIKIDN